MYLGLGQVGLLGFGLLGLRVSLKSFPGLWPVRQSPPFKFSSIRSSWVGPRGVAWGCVGLRGVGLFGYFGGYIVKYVVRDLPWETRYRAGWGDSCP